MKKIFLLFLIILSFWNCKLNNKYFKYLDIEWEKINAGYFIMGHGGIGGTKSLPNETPAVDVYLDDFLISKNEITCQQYFSFCKETGYPLPPKEKNVEFHSNYPITMVSWFDAMAFCKWLSKKTGTKISLPTEAQWEKAARGGTFGDTYLYVNINSYYPGKYTYENSYMNLLAKYEWFVFNSNDKIHPVGRLKPNPFDLFDMLGNVSEWCYDLYEEKYYLREEYLNPKGPKKKEVKKVENVIRGADISFEHNDIRCSMRCIADPNIKDSLLGFRIVMNLTEMKTRQELYEESLKKKK